MKSKNISFSLPYDDEHGEYWIPVGYKDPSIDALHFIHLHRLCGPAYQSNCTSHWVVKGTRHRIDGPATVPHSKATRYHYEWFLHGVCWYR